MTAREFQKRFMFSTLVVALATITFVSGYLVALLRFSAEEWAWFCGIIAVFAPVMFVGTQLITRLVTGPILTWLAQEEREAGSASEEEKKRAFEHLARMPLWCSYSGFVWWTAGGLVVATGMMLRFDGFPLHAMLMIVIAASSGGFIASAFHFFYIKRLYAELLETIAQGIDADERRRLSTRVSLRYKLIVSITGVSLVTVVFAMFLAMVRSGEALERHATQVQIAFLSELAEEYADYSRVDLEEATERARRLSIATVVTGYDLETRKNITGRNDLLEGAELDAVFAAEAGSSEAIDSANAYAWIHVPSHGIAMVSVLPWSMLRGSAGVTGFFVAIAVVVSGGISLLLAFLLSRDVGARTDLLERAAARVASGDLTARVAMEAEDELGDLGLAFAAMADALRTTVGRVAETADLIESRTGQLASISETVGGGAKDQSRGVREAIDAMERMNVQVAGITSSAQELNLVVEESSSSILEMGAAGDELNDTAGVLSSRVEEVSSSVEQMVRSVQEVSSQTDALSNVANETSSSMEEMASAMREVDTLAAAASQLSQHALETSEGGRTRVQETIEGIELIRNATTTAERVIAGLGDRTKEIGGILDVIDDVADETNLLALNAAIIAAQAGEHGRAFSVVADEIKELADRVLASTKEIGGLIRAVQEESANAVEAITEGSRSVAVGVERSRQAGASLEEIMQASRESGQRILEIVRSVQEQSKAANHVAEMMERVNEGVTAIHRATDEQGRGNEVVYRSMTTMREVAQQVRGTTEEQSRGSQRLRQSTDGVRDAVEKINAALQSQSSACQEVVGFLEEVSAGSQANDVSSERLSETTVGLRKQAQSLRASLRKFKLEG